ncbi:GTP pyrophosphokinase family protein [Holzapfeliella sp. He02]|uniref:GTP pyrophosphokinase family protein n=1 Tax=Holzapfeliella saturejae TaxID=3082953 RepID=A0ABU8SH42_9LACO
MIKDWKKFLWPYQQAVNELKVKFRGLRVSYLDQTNHSPIEFVTGRVKPVESIEEKLKRRYVAEELIEQDLQDIAGIRIMCPFVEDVYQVIDVIHSRTDMTVVEERDYIQNDKPSGYRSYHMVIEYPVYQYNEEKKVVLAEIQLRTLAMNFWATLEHSLNYKYPNDYAPEVKDRLKDVAQKAYELDVEMSEIRKEIEESHRRQQLTQNLKQ